MGEWRSSGGKRYYRETGSGFSSGGQNSNVSSGSSSSSSSSGSSGGGSPPIESTAQRNQRLLTEGMQKVNESPEAYAQWRSATVQKYSSSSGSTSVTQSVLNQTDNRSKTLYAVKTEIPQEEQKSVVSSNFYNKMGDDYRRRNTMQSQAPIYLRPGKKEEKKAPIYSKGNLSQTGYEERILNQIKREEKGQERVDALTTSMGIGRNEKKSPWNLKEIGKTIARQPFEMGKGLATIGGRVSLAIDTAVTQKGGIKKIVNKKIIKETGSAVREVFIHKDATTGKLSFTPQNLINVAFVGMAVKGGANARVNARAVNKPSTVKSTTTANAIKNTKGQTTGYKLKTQGTITRGKKTATFEQNVVSKAYGKNVIQKGTASIKQGSKVKIYKADNVASTRGISLKGLEQTKSAGSYQLLKTRLSGKLTTGGKGINRNVRVQLSKVAKPKGKISHSSQDVITKPTGQFSGISKGKGVMTTKGSVKPMPTKTGIKGSVKPMPTKTGIKFKTKQSFSPIKKPSKIKVSTTGNGFNKNIRLQIKKPSFGKKGSQSFGSRSSDLTGNRFQSTGLERTRPTSVGRATPKVKATTGSSFQNPNLSKPNLTGLGGLLGKAQAGFIIPVVPVSKSGGGSRERGSSKPASKTNLFDKTKPVDKPTPQAPAIGYARPVSDSGGRTKPKTEPRPTPRPPDIVNIFNPEPQPPRPPPPGLLPFAVLPMGIGGLATQGNLFGRRGARTKKKSQYTFSLEAFDKGISVKSFKQLTKKQKKITPGVLRPVIKGRGLIY